MLNSKHSLNESDKLLQRGSRGSLEKSLRKHFKLTPDINGHFIVHSSASGGSQQRSVRIETAVAAIQRMNWN